MITNHCTFSLGNTQCWSHTAYCVGIWCFERNTAWFPKSWIIYWRKKNCTSSERNSGCLEEWSIVCWDAASSKGLQDLHDQTHCIISKLMYAVSWLCRSLEEHQKVDLRGGASMYVYKYIYIYVSVEWIPILVTKFLATKQDCTKTFYSKNK